VQTEPDDHHGEYRERSDQQSWVLDGASLLERHHLGKVNVIGTQVFSKQYLGE